MERIEQMKKTLAEAWKHLEEAKSMRQGERAAHARDKKDKK